MHCVLPASASILLLLLSLSFSIPTVQCLFTSSITSAFDSKNLPPRIIARRNSGHHHGSVVRMSSLSDWSEQTGESALRQVQRMASKVAESKDVGYADVRDQDYENSPKNVAGTGGDVFKQRSKQVLDQQSSVLRPNYQLSSRNKREEQVWSALKNLELDMQMLDDQAGQQPQLTKLEFIMLSLSVTAAASGPFIMGGELTEFLAPTSAAFSAAIGIGAEYVGRVSVADGKEVAAATIVCAAEAEGFLANAERAKAITPLCVGVSATATTLSLLVPVLLENADTFILGELYLACPIISVLSAAVAGLALQDTRLFARRATSVGNRRFARSGLVGRTWTSSPEQIKNKSESSQKKWRSLFLNVLPAPFVGVLIPGADFNTKSIIVTALAAAQTAYLLTKCEDVLARATDACAVKARSAAVCDTYANQGTRSAAILPFTSALSGLCAAATAAIVELPFLESLSAAGTLGSLTSEMVVVAAFPALSALFAAAASVSKARCEVQSEAAMQAASTLALEYSSDDDENPILRPFRGVIELIQLTYRSSVKAPVLRVLQRIGKLTFFRKVRMLLARRRSLE
ncbi:unnamed protein product [Cylindrotheca closterium]|uniref:H(+)-exporting diphosphatase n=1 Tax=Cylindrotheca closterium TaxID=2856 RepID=A0AAD2FWD1_9STRA|nr:unnamed protein product [Cylindrotheca closterium]